MNNILKDILANMESYRPFFMDTNQTKTYQDLKRYCCRLQKYFCNLQVRKVLICLPQSFWAYVSIISSFLSGVTFCSIRSDDPEKRIKLYCDKYQPNLIITNQHYSCFSECELLNLDDWIKESYDDQGECTYFVNQEIAYVMFTSGSTGFPKGVKIKREALLHICRWMKQEFNLTEHDICSQYANMNYDMSLIDIFLAITSGAALVPFSTFQDKLFPGGKIKKFGITFWHSVPNVIDMLYAQNQLNPHVLNSIKKCKFGGETIYPGQLERFFSAVPEAEVMLTYGLTEITFICSYLKCNKDNYRNYAKRNMSLGHAIDGWNMTLLNTKDEIGEIVIYGCYVGAGYLDNQLSSDKFRKLELNGIQEDAFLTGDLGIYIDNMLYCTGRCDFQIKVKGNRIDLSEIDRVMRELADCVASYTFIHKDKLICTFISHHQTEKQIHKILASELPKSYMPQYIFEVLSYPKNNSGKIDRKQLISNLIGMNKIPGDSEGDI